jgi:hypothetical protein
MTLSSILTYDQDAPRRPTIDDLGGGAFQDHPLYPPNPTEHPSAGMFNQATKQIVALAKMSASIKLQVEFPGGVPTITQLVALGTKLTAENFVAVGGQILDGGPGNTLIRLPPAIVVPQLISPSGLTIVEDVDIDRIKAFAGNGGFWVVTKLGGVGTDAAFVIQVN